MVVLMRLALTALALASILLVLAMGTAWPPRASAAQDTQVTEVTAERFTFTPSEIRVKAGTPMEIRLTSEDTMHGFRIIGTEVDVTIPKRARGVALVTFRPEVGTYTFECSELCGAGHSFMRGVIIAE